MDLAISKLSSLLHESLNIFCIQHIASNGDGTSTIFFDGISNRLSLRYSGVSVDLAFELRGSDLHRYPIRSLLLLHLQKAGQLQHRCLA
jgi:hypothetical protein